VLIEKLVPDMTISNPARNMAGNGLGHISEKCPDSGFAKAEIQYRATYLVIKVQRNAVLSPPCIPSL